MQVSTLPTYLPTFLLTYLLASSEAERRGGPLDAPPRGTDEERVRWLLEQDARIEQETIDMLGVSAAILASPELREVARAEEGRPVAEALRARYPAMFKPSHGCRPPHVNVDVLREEMHRAQLLRREGLTTAEQLIGWIEARNEELSARDAAEWGKSVRIKTDSALEKALAKAKNEGFYLGLTWDWVQEGGK